MGKVSVVSDKWRILGIMRSSVCHTSYCSQKPCLKSGLENICFLLFVLCCNELLGGCVIPLKSNIRRHLASHLALINSKRHFAEIMIGCIPSAAP